MGVCRVRALIRAPLPRVWAFITDPRNVPLWVPYIESVTGLDRPFQTGDQMTQWRRDFFRRYSQEVLVEEVIPHRSIRLRDLSPGGRRMDATATVSVAEVPNAAQTWIEEAIAFSLGDGPVARRADQWLVTPLVGVVIRRKTTRAFRGLAELLSKGGAGGETGAAPGTTAPRPRE
jgi:uncharacterized protein YndB with AHSA1/START domain